MSVTAEAMVSVASPQRARLTWPRVLPAFLLVVVTILVAYRDTLGEMIAAWSRSETYMHGYTVVPIALWLAWMRRDHVVAQTPRPVAWMLAPIAAAATVWMLGEMASVNAVKQLAFVGLLVLAVPTLLGPQVARRLLFPLCFLVFAVPVGEFFVPQLMEWTAGFTVAALRASGIPVYQEGLQFVIPSGSWSVIDACSGVRYLIASLMVGTLFAYLNYTSLRRRLAFVLVAALVPIVANWVRAYMIVMLGHLSNNRLAAGVDHLIYGWVFFGVVIMAMFAIGSRWTQPPLPPQSPSSGTASRAMVAGNHSGMVWMVAAGAIVLTLLPHLGTWTLGRLDVEAPVRLAPLASPAGGWRAAPQADTDWQPLFRAPAAQSNAVFANGDGREVSVHIAYFRRQDRGGKLVSSSNLLIAADAPWAQVGQGSRAVELAGRPAVVRTARLRGSAHAALATDVGLLVWQVYWADGRLTASDIRAKLYGALQRLRGHGDDAAAITLYTRTAYGASPDDEADARLESFATSNWAGIEQQLRQARDAR